MEFDFSKLNEREFEALAASIIQKSLNKKVEIFKSGKDGGVDGRFWIGKKEGIIQCQHYQSTPYATLISKLKSEESIKVKKLNPTKYIFVTSKQLSRANKNDIKEIFNPHIKSASDVWGVEDLNLFLSKKENVDIVERHFKLWITSTSVLDIIFNNAIKGRSESIIRDIKVRAHKYIFTENHNKGHKILEENNVIILTGEPGIGKTTLANNLALFYLSKGYEFYDIEENISEAENIFRESEKRKILFYCDDFLGSNLYDAISNKRDSHIVRFISRIRKDNSKKFILTSRTNILNKAFSLSHVFQNEKIRQNEYLLKIENLTNIDKARILYNHIYHSNLNEGFIEKIYQNRRYRDIINHRNFNPRIIEFILDSSFVGHVKEDEYWEYITSSLNNPKVIWRDYFQNQADDCIRALTFLIVFNNGQISEPILRKSYNKFLKMHRVNLGDHSDKSFEAVRKLATKSLLNRNQIGDNSFEYVLFNPSIADFVLNTYSKETDLISNLLQALETKASIRYFGSVIKSGKIDSNSKDIILKNLFDYFLEKKIEEEDWDFLITLSYVDFLNEKINKNIEQFIQALINATNPTGNKLWELLFILLDFEPKIKFKNFKFLYNFLNAVDDEYTLEKLLDFVDKYKVDDEYIIEQLEDLIEEYLTNIIDNKELDIQFEKYINYQVYDSDGFPEYDINLNGLEDEIREKLDSCLDNLNENVLEKISFDTDRIMSSIDVSSMMDSFLESYEPEYERNFDGLFHKTSSEDDIDAIFERS